MLSALFGKKKDKKKAAAPLPKGKKKELSRTSELRMIRQDIAEDLDALIAEYGSDMQGGTTHSA